MIAVNPKARGLIFDLDGTVADTMPVHFIAWRNAVAQYGIDFTPELFEPLAGVTLYESIERLNAMFGTRMDPQKVGDAKEADYEKIMHKATPIKPVVDLIRAQYGKLPMAVGTSGWKRIAVKTLEIAGVRQYFDIIVSAEDVTRYKPNPDVFLRCAELMGVEPQLCQVFEDGAAGIEAAYAAGMFVTDVKQFYKVTIGREL
ncbi:MAG: HAD-IA family hydrolase [Bacteroidales bacterium]|jgi:beta-phosphoglucomutase family hydrolase|nr:HAD-IA family hydrolase [Bacteroidales bacterium]